LEPLLPRTRAVVLGCGIAVLALIVLVCAMVSSDVGRVAFSAAIIVSTASALLAGTCYRLREVRRRRGNLLRPRRDAEADHQRAQLPPRETIARRFKVSVSGMSVGLTGLTAVAVIGYLTSDSPKDGSWYIVAALLGIVFTALSFVAATYGRPLD
jgi:hypothetical protein